MRGLDPKPVPPEGSKIVGQHKDGRPIYELRERTQVGKKPRVVNGEAVWKKHQTTGEPMYPVFDRVMGEEVRVFVLEPMRNGNVLINENFRQNEEDEKRAEQRQKVAAFQSQLAEKAIERGLSPEDLLDTLAELASTTPAA